MALAMSLGASCGTRWLLPGGDQVLPVGPAGCHSSVALKASVPLPQGEPAAGPGGDHSQWHVGQRLHFSHRADLRHGDRVILVLPLQRGQVARGE